MPVFESRLPSTKLSDQELLSFRESESIRWTTKCSETNYLIGDKGVIPKCVELPRNSTENRGVTEMAVLK